MSNHIPHLSEIHTHITSINGNIPTHRRESKRKYAFSHLPFAEQLAIWDELWRTHDSFYLRLHAYFFLERHLKNPAELRQMWPVVVNWQNQVNDWPLCDSLSKIYTKILVVMPGEVYASSSNGTPTPTFGCVGNRWYPYCITVAPKSSTPHSVTLRHW